MAQAMGEILKGYKTVYMDETWHGILRERRQILRLTQKEVADRAGIGLQHYQKFETEARKLNKASFDVACRVLEALEMNIADYFHGKYAIGEEVFFDQDGKERYVATGRLTSEDVTGD